MTGSTKEYKWVLPNRLAFQEGNIPILYVLWHLSIDFLTLVSCQQVRLNSGPISFLHLEQWQRDQTKDFYIFSVPDFLKKEAVVEKLNLTSICKKWICRRKSNSLFDNCCAVFCSSTCKWLYYFFSTSDINVIFPFHKGRNCGLPGILRI